MKPFILLFSRIWALLTLFAFSIATGETTFGQVPTSIPLYNGYEPITSAPPPTPQPPYINVKTGKRKKALDMIGQWAMREFKINGVSHEPYVHLRLATFEVTLDMNGNILTRRQTNIVKVINGGGMFKVPKDRSRPHKEENGTVKEDLPILKYSVPSADTWILLEATFTNEKGTLHEKSMRTQHLFLVQKNS